MIYADDLQVYLQCSYEDLKPTLRRLCANARCVSDWAARNHLRLNTGKTKTIVFGNLFFTSKLSGTTVDLGNESVYLESSVRCLGVTLDASLSWKEQVRLMCRKANSLMYRLHYFRKSTNQLLRKHLIQALLFPLVDYCCVVLSDISKEQNLKIQRVLNTGVRYIYGIRKSEHITPYRRELGWLRAVERRQYFAACLLYRILRTGEPAYLARFFLCRVNPRPSREGGSLPLVLPSHRTEALSRSFHVSAAKMWNSLPSRIINASSLVVFKRLVYQHLFASERDL